MARSVVKIALTMLTFFCSAYAFAPCCFNSHQSTVQKSVGTTRPRFDTELYLAKKKRRRKNPVPTTPADDAVEEPQVKKDIDAAGPQPMEGMAQPGSKIDEMAYDPISSEGAKGKTGDANDDENEVDLVQLAEVAEFKFTPGDDAIKKDDDKSTIPGGADTSLPLPNIRDVLKKKEIEKELAKIEAEKELNKVKIKRSDKDAFAKLLEQQPFADADDSFFEEEEYGTVSALLGERAKPFLGIPTGPLQVGHFIGALGIVLMAFVEYPGFPLTNLPSPLRGALQGGLGTVYAINIVLAVLAAFKAMERGQPTVLWVLKTLSVGGLAFDQLTQLPTLEQIEKAKNQKGKRALKNKKNK